MAKPLHVKTFLCTPLQLSGNKKNEHYNYKLTISNISDNQDLALKMCLFKEFTPPKKDATLYHTMRI